MQNLDSYFKEHDLLESPELLEAHAERHLVKVAKSVKLPHLAILHYKDEVNFGKGKWTPFAKCCRGVIVDLQHKRILTKPFFKFWNLGQDQSPSIKALEKLPGFYITEKLDGSMGQTFFDEVTNGYYVSTKGSIDSEQGAWATTQLPEQLKDKKLVTTHTLMWEIISKQFRVVIPYDKKGYEDGLYLIGIRENHSQKLFMPDEVQAFAKEYKLKTFKTYDYFRLETVIEEAKRLPFMEEGFVLRFKGEPELLVKIKSPEYLRVHRFISQLEDKNLLDILIEGNEKDILDNMCLVPEEFRQDVEDTFKRYQKMAYEFRNECYEVFNKAPKEDRKTFALFVNTQEQKYKAFLFEIYDNVPIELRYIYQYFRKAKI